MSKKSRIYIPGAIYHVILRGNDHRDIFADDKERFRFFSILDILDGLEEEPPTKPDLEMVLAAVEAVIGPDAPRLLTSAARDARSFEVRALAAWAVLQFSGATLSELARFCSRDQSTMSCAARRIEEWQPVRPDLADKMAQLRSVLTHHPAPTARPKGIEVRSTPSTDA